MRKDLGAKPFIYPQPVLIVASYGEDGTPDAMNVAYGGIVNSNRLQINIGGHDVPDKIEKSGFHLRKSEFVDAPVIEDLPIVLECKVEEINQYDKTLRIVAEIVNTSVDEKILDADGNVDPEKLKAISYDPSTHNYLKLNGKAGTAFSDGNQLK